MQRANEKTLTERGLYSAKHITLDKKKFVELRNSQLKNLLVLFQPVTFENSNTNRASNNPAPPKYSEKQETWLHDVLD